MLAAAAACAMHEIAAVGANRRRSHRRDAERRGIGMPEQHLVVVAGRYVGQDARHKRMIPEAFGIAAHGGVGLRAARDEAVEHPRKMTPRRRSRNRRARESPRDAGRSALRCGRRHCGRAVRCQAMRCRLGLLSSSLLPLHFPARHSTPRLHGRMFRGLKQAVSELRPSQPAGRRRYYAGKHQVWTADIGRRPIMKITPNRGTLGAKIEGIDLSKPLVPGQLRPVFCGRSARMACSAFRSRASTRCR